MTDGDTSGRSGRTGETRVRSARSGDRDALRCLQGELPRPNPDLLRAALDGVGQLLVSTAGGCEDGGIPVGYLLALKRVAGPEGPDDRRSPSGDGCAGEGGAYVAELVVAPEHRREGRATELLSALAADCSDGWITLTVAVENDAARRCYESAGFHELRRAPKFFGDDPAIVMGRRLGGDGHDR